MDHLEIVARGWATLAVDPAVQARALEFLRRWLEEAEFAPERPQLQWLIEQGKWGELLDAFSQILPFGTGGRRGPVGIGPNRMNFWTLGASVQGHCAYLQARFPGEPRLTVVVAYDVRRFEDVRRVYNPELPNPILHMTSRDLAQYAARIYAANGVHVHLPAPESSRFWATPELSFAIRRLKAHGGLNVSASHNPPDDNGGKFYDERGAQPVPPDDQLMSDFVDQVAGIRILPWVDAVRSGRLHWLDERLHREYIELCRRQRLADPPRADEIRIVFTPLHGVGSMTALEALQAAGFRPIPVAEQMTPDGLFPNVTRSPNPEVPESLDRAERVAKEHQAHLVIATDPDADRIGGLVSRSPDGGGEFRFLTGHEICQLLTHFKLSRLTRAGMMPASPFVVTTEVTSSMVGRIARSFNVQVIENLLVGFKHIAEVLRRIETDGEYEDVRGSVDDFLLGCEESHGVQTTAELRDKDAGGAAVLLAELALEQRRQGRTVIDYLETLARQFGYFRNEVLNVAMTGIEGQARLMAMMESLRRDPPRELAGVPVTSVDDLRDPSGRLGPLQGATDASRRNVLIFRLGEVGKVVLRPSGTEPKAKAYLEVRSPPWQAGVSGEAWRRQCQDVDALTQRLATEFLTLALGRVGLTPLPGADRLSR